MVVQHNLTAMNSNRMMNMVVKSQAKSTEKLSSGYRINRAADDAAGLSISEKMRKQVRGLTQASANAQDGISTVQTAEGALNEVQDMLQRMNELAVKAANGTNSADDRGYIQNEIDQLISEVDRVAETTKFNETYLLKGGDNGKNRYGFMTKATGSYTTGTISERNSAETKLRFSANHNEFPGLKTEMADKFAYDFATKGIDITVADDAGTLVVADMKMEGYTFELPGNYRWYGNGTTPPTEEIIVKNEAGQIVAKMNGGVDRGAVAGTKKLYGDPDTYRMTVDRTTIYRFYDENGNAIPNESLNDYIDYDEDADKYSFIPGKQLYNEYGFPIKFLGDIDRELKHMLKRTEYSRDLELKIHVGADATSNNQITIDIRELTAYGLGISKLRVDGEDGTNALNAINLVGSAIRKVSTQRSELGAAQNRLEHTINNLDNVTENTTAAEAAIRDTDMAAEMVKFSNNNILAQAGQAMLAQANQSNQGVLSLLQQ